MIMIVIVRGLSVSLRRPRNKALGDLGYLRQCIQASSEATGQLLRQLPHPKTVGTMPSWRGFLVVGNLKGKSQSQWHERVATLPETNSEFTPENGWLEDKPFLSFGVSASWQVQVLLVSGVV